MLSHSSSDMSSTSEGPFVVLIALASTIFGILIGYAFSLKRNSSIDERSSHDNSKKWHREVSWGMEGNAQHDSPRDRNAMQVCGSRSALAPVDDKEDIGASQRVLAGAVSLFCRQWDVAQPNAAQDVNSIVVQGQPQDDKVVRYLEPEDMLAKLFSTDSSISSDGSMIRSLSLHRRKRIRINENDDNDSGDSHSSNHKANDFLHLLSQIQQYSVNTSHPNFFNQLFGALDPIALASELLALSLNTSAYTYETAPVFTMIEHEVMQRLGRLVFEGKDEVEENDDIDNYECHENFARPIKYDGLMVPGGSLSNLTALHIARHHWLVTNEYDTPIRSRQNNSSRIEENSAVEENADEESSWDEKKDDCPTATNTTSALSFPSTFDEDHGNGNVPPRLVAFVSTEAHYSFRKAMAVTGIGASNLIAVPTLTNGQMDAKALDEAIRGAKLRGLAPFFVAVTAGSTVRGSFDDIEAIINVCRQHEDIEYVNGDTANVRRNRIWVHVDGAWGGSAIFSRRPDVTKLLAGVEQADSFTFNPHKMLGAPNQTAAFVTRHHGLLKASNSTGAKYLFDPRKNGAEYDLGDSTYTCGRRPDAIKLWALWKYYGREGLGKRIDDKVDSLSHLARLIQQNDSFMLACEPWPFNINFFYLPPRIRQSLKGRGIPTDLPQCGGKLPDDISKDLAKVSVELKLRLHEAGEMIIPFQPLNDQKADCFRLVLAGNKTLSCDEFREILAVMDRYGNDL